MSPQLLNESGDVLYGPGSYPREFAVAQGVVGYHKDPAAAANDARVVGNPVTVKGVGTAGSLATDVVLSTADAQRVMSFAGFAEAIASCRVMFILD
jgi:glutamate dehydrogenase/leucine dehydrogenase